MNDGDLYRNDYTSTGRGWPLAIVPEACTGLGKDTLRFVSLFGNVIHSSLTRFISTSNGLYYRYATNHSR